MQNLFKKIQMNLFTQQKQTHRLREQTYSFKEWRTRGEWQHQKEHRNLKAMDTLLHFSCVSDARASSQLLPAASALLIPADDALFLRWDFSPTGSAGPAHSQRLPWYTEWLSPQPSAFVVPSSPHCPGLLSVFQILPGHFVSHVVFDSSVMRERERGRKQFLEKLNLLFFFFPITFQNNASKSALLRTTKSQKDSSLHTSIQNSHASLHCFWPPPTNLCQKSEHWGQNHGPLSDVFFRKVKG